MQNTCVQTPKGTSLPLLNLKNGQYLEVKYRVVWFREVCPDWSILTSIVEKTKDHCVFRAEILDPSGRIIAVSHKCENMKDFYDFMEKAETGAIGRALALIGFGTQFTNDLDEGNRIVDSPASKSSNSKKSPPKVDVSTLPKPKDKISREELLSQLWTVLKRRLTTDEAAQAMLIELTGKNKTSEMTVEDLMSAKLQLEQTLL